jgi:hypothetical protein
VSGEASRQSRIAILKRARKEGISLYKLSHFLDVKWTHFEEWASDYEENTISIFLEHLPWKDELLHPDNIELRNRLEVGDGGFKDEDEISIDNGL